MRSKDHRAAGRQGRLITQSALSLSVLVAAMISLPDRVAGQVPACDPMWSDQFARAELDPSDSRVHSLIEYDPDGAGPRPPLLAMSGSLVITRHRPNSFVAFFDGVKWTSADGPASAAGKLICYDEDGPGPRPASLFAAGDFQFEGETQPWEGIGRWDGAAWSSVGRGLSLDGGTGSVTAMAIYDEVGPGPLQPVLVVSGNFTQAGGIPANYIARWDGAHWSPLGDGLAYATNGLTVFDADGDGPAPPLLVAGEGHRGPGGTFAPAVSTWDGQRWSLLSVGGSMNSLAVFDEDGSGPAPPRLFGGGFNVIVRWNGSSWLPFGSGISGSGVDLRVIDADGPGPRTPELFVAGGLQRVGTDVFTPIARWSGRAWSIPAEGARGRANSITSWDPDGPGPSTASVYLGGQFQKVDDGTISFHSVLKLDHGRFTGIGRDLSANSELPPRIQQLAWYDEDGGGPKERMLVARGWFYSAGGELAFNIAAWNGGRWQNLGEGLGTPFEPMLQFDDDGDGSDPPYLYAAGRYNGQEEFSGLVRWNGARWSAHPQPVDGLVQTMAHWDPDGAGPQRPVLVVGGSFDHAGSLPVDHLAAWDGFSWSAFEGSDSGGRGGAVTAIVEFPNGGEPPGLVVARRLVSSDGTARNLIALWDGQAWSPLGGAFEGGTNPFACCLTVFDEDGAGPRPPMLFAAGQFLFSGDAPLHHVARWDGVQWSDVGGGFTHSSLPYRAFVSALAVHDEDGPGPAPANLFATGGFDTAGGRPAQMIAKWDGNQWHEVCIPEAPAPGESLTNPIGLALLPSHGTGSEPPVLFMAGYFKKICGQYASSLSALTAFPWLYEQPENCIIPPGQTAFFRIRAGGPGALTYQWRRRGTPLIDGPDVSGSQTPTLILRSAKDPGPYDVEIRNECGPIISQSARLVVRPRPLETPRSLTSE